MAFPEPLIRSNWGEFVIELDKLFGELDMAQASERALRSLKMQENHHINKFMIEFAEHTAFTGWNDVALYGKFYRGLAERIKDQLLNFDCPPTLEKLKIDALKCDNRYWEQQHEKGPAQSTSRVKPPPVAPTGQQKASPTPRTTENSSTPRKDLGNVLGANGKLTEAEKEWHHLKNLCMYCGCPFNKYDPLCRF